ncbi:MAG TPA: DUF2270 domain-containing protein [Deltaproteobacteria bacterium]|nr:DUF2270 domain-containing protein [Deltaproteobacteria bacterium]
MTSGIAIGDRDRTTVLMHYYRAMVGRADIWRTRMDATTNWAIGVTAAVVSLELGNPAIPHFGIYIASLLTVGFLLLEARRLSFYHLWQSRVLLLEEGLIRTALAREGGPSDAAGVDLADLLDPHLGRTVPTMPASRAIARRLRRVYLYLFAVQLLAWGDKLVSDPAPAHSIRESIDRAGIWMVPGPAVVSITISFFVLACVLALVRGGVDRKAG